MSFITAKARMCLHQDQDKTSDVSVEVELAVTVNGDGKDVALLKVKDKPFTEYVLDDGALDLAKLQRVVSIRCEKEYEYLVKRLNKAERE